MEVDWPALRAMTDQDCRFFSVDGGHTAEVTANDLRIADAALTLEGVICLDDYFNREFPEVSVGLCRVMEGANLSPFGIAENKLFLCRPERQAAYAELLRAAARPEEHVKDAEFFGAPTPVLRRPRSAFDRVKSSPLARLLKDTAVGEALKPLVRRVLRRR